VAESDENDARVVTPVREGGLGVDAQWSDDFHHALHGLLTGERAGYYRDFGRLRDLAVAFEEGFVYAGQHSPFRGRPHGTSSRQVPGRRLVVCAQNHDQVGNRMLGERLGHLVSFERAKLASAALLVAPFVPLIFMGQEYAETAPFLYFVSHSDPGLVEAVRRGRREEFAAFAWWGEVPDPQAEETFRRSTLDHSLCEREPHRAMRGFHRELLRLRRDLPALASLDKTRCEVQGLDDAQVLVVRRWSESSDVVGLLAFGDQPTEVTVPAPPGAWRVAIDSADRQWRGPGTRVGPEHLSGGLLTLSVGPSQAVLLVRED
jgi:maltooligosyltrehalose trehalohydrolase